MWKRQLILSTLWLAAVGWYWREFVPLRATRSRPLRYESTVCGWTPEGHAIIPRAQVDATGQYVEHLAGPVSVWRLPELEKVSERLGFGDVISPGGIDPTSQIAAVGEGTMRRMVDLTSGVTLEDVPGDVQCTVMRPGREGRVLYLRADSVTLRDPRSSRDVWKVQGINARYGHVQGDLVVLNTVNFLSEVQGIAASSRRSCLLLNAATGEVDTRFDALGQFASVIISKDGRWALVNVASGLSHICDAKTGRRLWPLTYRFENAPQFDTKEDELVLYWATPSGEFRESRWRCSDGAALTALPTSYYWANRRIDSAGRYALESTYTRGHFERFCSAFLNPALKAVGSKTRLPTERSILKVRDLSTGRIVGPLPANAFVDFVPGRSAAIAVGGNRIDLFEFPFGRDWTWLAWYGAFPVAIAFGGRGLWWTFRRRGK